MRSWVYHIALRLTPLPVCRERSNLRNLAWIARVGNEVADVEGDNVGVLHKCLGIKKRGIPSGDVSLVR